MGKEKNRNKNEIINYITAQNINNNKNVGAGLVSAQSHKELQTNIGVVCHATQKGITLISLIITIIILLILAGVALNLTIGENGIFKLASNSSEKYENSAQKEEYDLAQLNNNIGGYVSGGRQDNERFYHMIVTTSNTETRNYYDLPEGFTSDNCIVVSYQTYHKTENVFYVNYCENNATWIALTGDNKIMLECRATVLQGTEARILLYKFK